MPNHVEHLFWVCFFLLFSLENFFYCSVLRIFCIFYILAVCWYVTCQYFSLPSKFLFTGSLDEVQFIIFSCTDEAGDVEKLSAQPYTTKTLYYACFIFPRSVIVS